MLERDFWVLHNLVRIIGSCFWVYLILIFLFIGCSSGDSFSFKDHNEVSYPLYTANNIYFSTFDGGEKKFDLWADRLDVYKNENDVETREISGSVVFHLFDHNDTKIIELYSDRLTYDDRENSYRFHDNVFMKSMDEFRLYCDTLIWDRKRGTIESNTKIRVVTKQDSIDGLGFESSESVSNYTVYKVTGRVRVEQ